MRLAGGRTPGGWLCGVIESDAAGQAIQRLRISRQAMALMAHVELDAVFGVTQKLIGRGQAGVIAITDQALVVQLTQGMQRPPGAHPLCLPAIESLQTLDE